MIHSAAISSITRQCTSTRVKRHNHSGTTSGHWTITAAGAGKSLGPATTIVGCGITATATILAALAGDTAIPLLLTGPEKEARIPPSTVQRLAPQVQGRPPRRQALRRAHHRRVVRRLHRPWPLRPVAVERTGLGAEGPHVLRISDVNEDVSGNCAFVASSTR